MMHLVALRVRVIWMLSVKQSVGEERVGVFEGRNYATVSESVVCALALIVTVV